MYIALYRKWRPADFDDIKGQDAIVTTLRNQIEANRIGHAYLFCGTRGTGKTSAAKVFAKAVNCENPVNGNPCGKCESCLSIADGTSLNVIEMDAASNNGVDDARQIKESVVYSPTNGKYKVYIIDEAHQITKDAFNALLKTMEEPPAYVIFILATTEPHKIPVTILSRCQRYDFKRIATDTLEDRLKEVAAKEGITIEDKAIKYIATKAEGGMRDALSLLDQCSSFFLGKEITYERALEVLGAVDTSVFSEFLRALCARSVTDSINVVDMTADNMKLLQQEAKAISEKQLIRYIRVFSELANDLRFAVQKRVLIEIAVIKICKPQMETNPDSINDRLKVIEELIESGNLTKDTYREKTENAVGGVTASEKSLRNEATQSAMNLPKATIEDLKSISSAWGDVYRSMPEMYMACLRKATPSVRPDDGKFIIQFEDDTVMCLCDDESFKESLDKAFAKVMGKEVEYELTSMTQSSAGGVYYPPTSIFGMEVTVDDSEFE